MAVLHLIATLPMMFYKCVEFGFLYSAAEVSTFQNKNAKPKSRCSVKCEIIKIQTRTGIETTNLPVKI